MKRRTKSTILPFKRFTAWLTAIACSLVQITLPLPAEASHLGSSTASAGSVPPPSVSAVQSFQPDLFTGRATTAIPIAVPPGRKGIQPALALAYSSSARNGWLGVGWGLDLGAIERSTKRGTPRYDGTDPYLIAFQGVASELMRIPDGTYRLKDEGLFLRITDRGLAGWEVRDKSGVRYLFGQTAASQIEQTGQVFRWALDEVIDPNGNTLTVTYTKDQGQLYPAQIHYTGHEPTGLAPANAVEFILEDRPDDEVSYRSGFAVTTAKRLKALKAYATVQGQPQLARKHVLAYTTSGRTGRSLLSRVQQFGADGTTSVPATTFTYQDTGSAGYPNVLSNLQPTPSVAAWNVRHAGLDTGHETWGCAHPYLGLPWGSPIQAGGGFSLGGVSGSVSGNGDATMSGGNDQFGHLWTYVYISQPKTVSLSHASSNDAVACLYREDTGGVTQITNAGSIPLQAGWSILHLTAYHQHQGWGPTTLSGSLKSQVDVMNPGQIALGVPQLAGDVNGDAKTDLIKFNPSNGSWSVSCATSCTLSPGGPWLSGFGNSSSIPLLGDWNGDGKTDIGVMNSGGWQFATSTGTSFQTGTVSSLSLGSGTPFTGDFNGDGSTDIGTYSNGSWSVALGTGSGFSPSGGFSLGWGGSNDEALTGDFNGDGLTDIGIVNTSSGAIDVRLSTGSGWTAGSAWIGAFGGGNPHTSADFNGDGLTDAVSYNRPAGQVAYAPSTGTGFGSPVTLPLTFSLTSSDDNIQVGDFNGDGLADPAAFNLLSGSSQLALSSLTNGDGSNGTATDALRAMANGLGGVTTLRYQPSTLCGCEEESVLPFVLPVVQQATQEDGLGNRYTTTYRFHGGLYDAPTKEFRGFGEATVFDADGNKSITHFHQDTHKKGRPFLTEFRDQHDNLWTKTEPTWSCTEPYAGVHFVTLQQTDGFVYDGDATFRQTQTRFEYDSYGNLTRTLENGDVSIFGDERTTTTSFTYNPTGWILNKPSLVQTLDAGGAVVAQRRFFYDNATDSAIPPSKGNLTKEEEWLNGPTGSTGPTGATWLPTTLTYDPYGNVKTVTDALSRTTTNTYDTETATYLTKIANVLSHTRQLVYDPRFGQVTSTTDQNGVTATTEYDALGRVTKVIGPTDSSTLPTIRYEYDPCLSTSGCTAPVRTTVHSRIRSGEVAELTVHTFADGLGRTIQTRSPAEDPAKQVVAGAAEFDARGLVIKQWAPYLDAVSSSYVPHGVVPGLAPPVTYEYDPLGRLIKTTDPDGASSATTYDDWTVTVTDALGHRTRRLNDAYGRLIRVEEVNGTDTYTTTYEYDTLNNLTGVTDQQAHRTTISYDSLGRKLRMDDPDMGRWTYGYDDVDNLVSQTDARGVVISFAYDALNRLTRKDYSIPSPFTLDPSPPVAYTYDDPAVPLSKGRLTKVVDGSGSASFEYDRLGRIVKESKTIDSVTRTIQRSYDLLGRLTSLSYPDTEAALYTYNLQGGIETIDLTSATGPLRHLATDFNYNAAGQVTKIVYGNGVVTDYSYNPQTLRLDQLKTVGPTGTLQDFSYEFDQVGNVKTITDVVHYPTKPFQFTYDALNRLTRAEGAYGDLHYAYDPLGNMTEKEGVQMTYGLADGSKPHAVTATSDGLSLTYDANGNLLSKGSATGPLGHLVTQWFAYDAENRLVEVKTAPEETVTVTFQPGWNFFSLPVIPEDGAVVVLLPSFAQDFEQIAKFEPATGKFSHHVGNPKFDDFTTLEYGVGYQIYCKAAGPVTATFKGKLPTKKLSKSLTPGWHLLASTGLTTTTAAAWLTGVDYTDVRDASLNPVTQVEPGKAYWVKVRTASIFSLSLPRDPTTRFLYDGDGGRVKQTTTSGTTLHLGESFEQAADGTTTKYVFAGALRIAAVSNGPTGPPANGPTVRFYHGDHLGSSDIVTDATGAVVEHTEHRPFGAVSRHDSATSPPGHFATSFGFTGQRQDTTNGLILFPARTYDPDLGRFLQPDPFVQDPSDPQTLNRYTYVRNNPLRYVDPSGYGFFAFLVAVIAWAITIAVTVDSFEQAADIRNEQKRAQEAQQRSAPPATAPLVPTIGQRWSDFATQPAVVTGAGLLASLNPVTNALQDAAGLAGVDILTGDRLHWGWQITSGAALFIPFLGVVQIRQGVRALNEVIPKGAKYVYDATVKRYRHGPSGRFVAGRNLPFPANDGFRARTRGTLQPGAVVDRHGRPSGRFAGEPGASISERGLPPGSEALEYHRYEVMRPLDVDMGPAAAVPDFAATGEAMQYRFGRPISELVEEGYLRER